MFANVPLPVLLLALAWMLATAAPAAGDEPAARGEYLVNLLGCGRCHTQGYLLGDSAQGPHLAGSRVGIAYTDDEDGTSPGLTFAPNLTPDDGTGLGTWSRRDIIRALTTGVGTDGHQRLPVMPWPDYSALTEVDLNAVAAYLKSLAPVRRRIPDTTSPGDPVEYPYVRFGIFMFTPFEDEAPPQDDDARERGQPL
jgi:hypothetical protein